MMTCDRCPFALPSSPSKSISCATCPISAAIIGFYLSQPIILQAAYKNAINPATTRVRLAPVLPVVHTMGQSCQILAQCTVSPIYSPKVNTWHFRTNWHPFQKYCLLAFILAVFCICRKADCRKAGSRRYHNLSVFIQWSFQQRFPNVCPMSNYVYYILSS